MVDEIFVIITERDVHEDRGFLNSGAIIGETYVSKSDLISTLERARSIKSYGRVWIGRVELIGTIEDAEKLLESE